ncbi:Cysteine-rich, acidic integral membrane protein [Anabarilius grahami]|uniref:Cysteine-rich, acidic integral membrane protein n=1 Tax=Anabarilius grahami TaxID=495550 RepID=A0A3N0Y2W8_ANAGA|nr:Cysteine-rich, acidic integral membrane protein [Anabarilius grahami]
MGSKWIYVAILGMACMMLGVNGTDNSSSTASNSSISSNMTMNLTHTSPPNITTNLTMTPPPNTTINLTQTSPPNISTNLTMTHPPNITMNLTQTSPPNITTNLTITHPPNITMNLTQTSPPNITTNLTMTHPPNMTLNLTQTSPPNITTNLTITHPPNITMNLTQTSPPNITTNLTMTHPPNMTLNLTQTSPLNITTNLTMTHPPNMTLNLTQTSPPNITSNLTITHPPNITMNLTQTSPPNITTNLTITHPPNITMNLTQTSSPNITTNLTITHPPNMTMNLTQTSPPNITTNLTITHPPNITMNLTQTSPPNITTNLTITHPPNITMNLTQTSPPNITTNLTMTHSPNITMNLTQTSPPNITTNLTMTHSPNITMNLTQTSPPNITTNLTITHPPNITMNLTQTSPPNITTNLTITHPPNITMNLTHTSPPSIITNLTQTHPPNVANNITLPGSNIITNINNQSLEITGRDNCRRDRACFSAPPTCNPGAEGSCFFLSTKGITGNADNFTFELSGESDGYIAAGLSRDSSGQGATIYSCTNFNGVLRFIRATLNNQRLTQDNTFIPGSFRGSVNGRKIQCIFNAAGLGSSTARAATTETFVFVLTGSVSNGSLDSPVSRLATNGSVDLGNPNSTDAAVITPSTNATGSNVTATSNATASNTTTVSTNLTQTQPPNITMNMTQPGPLNMTTNSTQTSSPNITMNVTQPGPLNMTTNSTQTSPPNITMNVTQPGPLNMTTNSTQTHPPNITVNVTQPGPLNMTTNSTQMHPPNITMNVTQPGPLNMTTNSTHTRPPNITMNVTQPGPLNMTTNSTQTRPPNITMNVTQPGPLNMTINSTQTRPPNITMNVTQPGPLNMTTNSTQTRPPNITMNVTQPGPLNMTINSTQTRPPNITMNMTQPGPLNMTTNSTQTRPPNMTNNVTLSGSNTMTNNNIVSQSQEITSRDNCRRDRACFSAPPTCNPGAQSSCYFLSTRGITGNADNFTFELSGESDGYIAAGLSRDSTGQGATIYSCANFNGVLRFIRATLNNQRLTQDNTFIPGSFRGSVNGRKIQCIFNAAGLGSSTARAATTETFAFVLTGSVSNGSLDSPVSRLATNGSVDLGNPNSTDAAVITPSTNATESNATATSNTTASNTTTVSTNLTQTHPPNITMNMTQPGPLNMTTNSTQTRPPNITMNVTQPGPINMTTNSTRPPNMTNNVTLSGSNTMTNNNIVSQSQEITSRDNCRRDRACFSAPPTCNPGAQSSCYFLSTRGITGNADNFTFELSGESDGYIAAGLSRDSTGQGATIYSCANFNGVARFIRATLNNQRLTQDNTFIPGSFRGSVNGRKIQCIFNAAGLGSSTARAATTEPFVFVLTGSVSNGSLDSPVTRLATNGSVDLRNPNSTDVSVITPSVNTTASNATAAPNVTASSNATAASNATSSNVTANTGSTIVTRDSCKKDKACFSTPASCDPSTSNSCFFASTRGVSGSSDNLTFELSGESNGYIAVGLSQDNKEGDGDTIYSCANNNGVPKFIRATLNNNILTPDNTFGPGSFRGSVNNTKIQCIFIAAGLNINTRAANTNAFLFFYTGNFANGIMGSPVTRMATNSSVDLTNINSSDVGIITPTTNTASNTTTTANPTTGGSNTLQHVASQVNAAGWGSASQSVSYVNWYAPNALDLKRSTCTHTPEQSNPWWKLDLRKVYSVNRVVITNRPDCCSERINGAEIRIGNVSSDVFSNPICAVISSIPQGASDSYSCNRMEGRYVIVVIPGNNRILTLCEVEVYVVYPGNLAAGKSVTQSSTFDSWIAEQAIDFNPGFTQPESACSSTNSQTNPWWRLDLHHIYRVSKVVVTNRLDCCPERIDGAEIRIGNSLENDGSNNPICAVISSIPAGVSSTYVCKNMEGRYVNLIIPGDLRFLTLCEVEIYGEGPCLKQTFVKMKLKSSLNLSEAAARVRLLTQMESALAGRGISDVTLRWSQLPKQEVMRKAAAPENAALWRTASLSSQFESWIPRYAVDGLSDSCASADIQTDPWWRVDLLNEYQVNRVAITNRVGDTYYERINGAEIRVGNFPAHFYSNPICAVISTIPSGATANYSCGGMEGRYVIFHLPGDEKVLTLCEVEVYGYLLGNQAVGGAVIQSSTSGDWFAEKAIDGNRGLQQSNALCSSTLNETNPWWRLDMRNVYQVSRVVITNRNDCCAEQLDGLEIHIGNSLENNGNNNPICAVIPAIPAGESYNYSCDGMEGRYVNLIIPGDKKTLTLCEVEVFGKGPALKQSFVKMQFSSRHDLTNPTMRETFLIQLGSALADRGLTNVTLRWSQTPKQVIQKVNADKHLNASLQSVVEDYSPPDTPPAVPFNSEIRLEEEEDEEQEHTDDHFVPGIRPYMFEPLHAEGPNSQEQVHPREHLDVSQWCSCGYCQHMDTGPERLCCREVRQVCDRSAENGYKYEWLGVFPCLPDLKRGDQTGMESMEAAVLMDRKEPLVEPSARGPFLNALSRRSPRSASQTHSSSHTPARGALAAGRDDVKHERHRHPVALASPREVERE